VNRVQKGNSIEAAPSGPKSTWVKSTAEGRVFYYNSVRGCSCVSVPVPVSVPVSVSVSVSVCVFTSVW
jgi:hypothetical protein